MLLQDSCACFLCDFFDKKILTICFVDQLVLVMIDFGCVLVKQGRHIIHDLDVKRVPEENVSLDNRQSIVLEMFEEVFGQDSRKESFVGFDLFVLFLSEGLYFAGLD